MTTPIVPQRTCSACGCSYLRTVEHWHKNKARADGLATICKTCANEKQREWGHKNLDKVSARNRRWREKYPEKHRENQRRWTARNREHVNESRRDYYAKHREQIIARNKEAYKRNPTVSRSCALRWQREHPKEAQMRWKRWRDKHPEVGKAARNKRRALMDATSEHHTSADVREQIRTQKRKCWWCDEKIKGDKYHVDHRIPLSRGGSNGANNIVITCPHCNLSKNNKLPHEWSGRLL